MFLHGLLAVPLKDRISGVRRFSFASWRHAFYGGKGAGCRAYMDDARKLYGIGLGVAFAALVLVLPAESAIVREYSDVDIINQGEFSERDATGFPPASYVATSPFALSFAPKFEAPDESWDVAGLRINLLVCSHRAVYALDIGGLGNFSDYKMDGIGIAGLFNSVGESDGAIHIAGLCNFAAFDFAGCQISGLYSCTEGSHFGLQIGTANYAGKLTGVQIGLFNSAETLHGMQIGVLNFNKSSPIRFMPIINAAF